MLEAEINDLKQKLASEQLARETMARNANGSQKEMQDMLNSREARISELTKEVQQLKTKSSKQESSIDSLQQSLGTVKKEKEQEWKQVSSNFVLFYWTHGQYFRFLNFIIKIS